MKQPVFETVLFDLDGTLAKSAPGVLDCVVTTLQHMNKPVPDPETLRKFIGPPLCHSFMEFCGMTRQEADLGLAHYREIYLNGGIYNNSTFEGVPQLLAELKENGIKLCIATSKPEPLAHIVLEHLEIAPFFHFVAGADLEERKSSKMQLIQKGLAHCDTNPKNAVMIGDTQFDALGAQQAGTHFIGVLYGYGTKQEMQQHSAQTFASTVQELTELLLP